MNVPKLKETTIDSVIAELRYSTPTRSAICCDGEQLTFQELWDKANAFGGWLKEKGVAPGDRVGIWLPNCLAWAVAQLSVSLNGAIYVPINTRLTQSEAEHIILDSGCKVVVAVTDFLGRDYAEETESIVVTRNELSVSVVPVDLGNEMFPVSNVKQELPGANAGEAAAILYTSGTTGSPKGCMISHRSFTNCGRLTAQAWNLGAEDVVYCPAPLFFGYGSVTAMMGAITNGARFVTSRLFSPQKTLEEIQAVKATWFIGVPTMWTDLLEIADKDDLSSLRGGTWGGGPFPEQILQMALDPKGYGLDVVAIYGLTEALSITTLRSTAPRDKKKSTVGTANYLVDVKIVDELGNPLPKGVTGEVWARGYNACLGYWNQPDATVARFSGEWLRTGDLGTLDQENYLRIEGRFADLIIVGGSNVYVREVEETLEAIPGVRRAGVVAYPDKRLGEVPVAFIEVDESRLTEQEIIRQCKQLIAAYKTPRHVRIVHEVPLTATGKIHKAALRKMAETL